MGRKTRNPKRGNGYNFEMAFDPFASALTVIDEPHRMTHDGFVFHASGKVTGILDAGVQDFLMSCPANCFPHVQKWNINGGRGDIDLLWYEDTVTSSDGTPLLAVNTNRTSSNTPNCQAFINPTITDLGTIMTTNWAPPTGVGVGQTPNGTINVNEGEEWILKPATKYGFRMVNNSGATISARFEIVWYEIGEES